MPLRLLACLALLVLAGCGATGSFIPLATAECDFPVGGNNMNNRIGCLSAGGVLTMNQDLLQ